MGLELGADRVVIGTAAAMDPGFLAARSAARCPPSGWPSGWTRATGRVAVRGWTETSTLTAAELAQPGAGRRHRARSIYTDVARDGMLEGPDLDGALALQGQGAG